MILQSLANYFDRLETAGLVRLRGSDAVPPPGNSRENISFEIILLSNGKIETVNDLRIHDAKKPRPVPCVVPNALGARTSGIDPKFLWDKTAYVFGVSASSKRAAKEHQAFREFHKELLASAEDAGLIAFLSFLRSWNPKHFDTLRYADEMLDTNVVFRLDGERLFLHHSPAAQSIWLEYLRRAESVEGICLVTGKTGRIAPLHPSIKNVTGAQSSGAFVVSFNANAFTSYGLKDGTNAPVSERAAHGYATALNVLLSRREGVDAKTKRPKWTNRIQIGDATTVFWAEAAGGPESASSAEKAENLFATLLDPPTDEQEAAKLQALLQKIEQGRPVSEVDPNFEKMTFYVLGLSPNAARLSVRFFLRSTLGEFVAHGVAHYRDLSIEPPAWTTPPAAWRLLRETAAQGEADNVSPALAGEVARAILTGARYPRSLLAQTIMRVRADGDISPLRVAIAKACLVRSHRKDIEQGNPDPEEDVPVSLDRNEANSGYRLGRLFYVLENAQRMGIGRVSATVRDKFYASASANPARVFPLLLRGAQDHISAVRKKRGGGLAFWLDEQIAEIIGGLPASAPFPSTLRLEDQGRFIVGYYRQRHAAKAEGKEAEDLPEIDAEE